MSAQPRYRIVCADGSLRHRPQHPFDRVQIGRYTCSLNIHRPDCGPHRVEEVPG